MSPLPKTLIIAFLLIAIIGFGDAAFLTAKFYQGGVIPCFITAGCDTVTKSAYSTIGPVPLALLGAAYYLSLIILSLLYLDLKKPWLIRLAAHLTTLGFLASLYLVGLQLFAIKAICIYCMISAGSSTILFFLGFPIRRLTRPHAVI